MFAKSDVSYTLGSRGYFFLIDTDGSRQSRVNEAQSVNAASVSIRKKILWNPGYVSYWHQSWIMSKSCPV